jgi:hypothetical protein
VGVDTTTRSTLGAEDTMDDETVSTVRAGATSNDASSSAGSGRWQGFVDRVTGVVRRDRQPPRPPIPGAQMLRVTLGLLMATMCLLSVGGAVLLLLLWQQGRSSGVLTTQLDRTWDLIDTVQVIERWAAFGLVPVAMCWLALSAVNVRRATGIRRNPALVAGVLAAGVFGVWWVGREFVAGSDDPLNQGGGWAIQIAILAVVVIFVDRIATAADARHGPLRLALVVVAGYLAHLQFLGALSTIDRDTSTDRWGEFGAYLLMGGLVQVVGALAVNEAERSIEDATDHRYELRSRFSESLLAQAAVR